MAGQSRRRRRTFGRVSFTEEGLELQGKFKLLICYRRILLVVVLAVALYTGTNIATVLEWISNLLTLLGR